MPQYIDKEILVAEIERRIKCLDNYKGQSIVLIEGVKDHLRDLLSFVHTLKVK